MPDDPLIQAMETFSLLGVLLAFILFTRLAVKAKSLGSFRFRLSLFMLIWVLAEAPHIANTLGLISAVGYETYGLTFHMLSMMAFALLMGAKSIAFLRTPVQTHLRVNPPAVPQPATRGIPP